MTRVELMAQIYCAMIVKGEKPEDRESRELSSDLEYHADRFTAAMKQLISPDEIHRPITAGE